MNIYSINGIDYILPELYINVDKFRPQLYILKNYIKSKHYLNKTFIFSVKQLKYDDDFLQIKYILEIQTPIVVTILNFKEFPYKYKHNILYVKNIDIDRNDYVNITILLKETFKGFEKLID